MDVNSFHHPRVTNNFIKANNFRFSRGWSDENESAYVLSLPIYRYHSMPLLELRIVVYEGGETRIDVLDISTKGVYAPWYRHESYDRYPILKSVDDNIESLMFSMGFQKRGEEDERHESVKAEHQPRRSRRVQRISNTAYSRR